MADFHKYTFYYTSQEYADGYDRIFGKKAKDGSKTKTRKRKAIQGANAKAIQARSAQPEGTGGVDRAS